MYLWRLHLHLLDAQHLVGLDADLVVDFVNGDLHLLQILEPELPCLHLLFAWARVRALVSAQLLT